MEGDTPSFLGLIDNGLDAWRRPDWGGWGGRYIWRTPHGETHPIWTQGGDMFSRVTSQDTVRAADGRDYISDQATIWRWREAFQNDFAARMDWTVTDPAHANHNPCELEFLTQWSMTPPPPWLDAIFQPYPDGLGLTCPIVMVHGNHEGFAHLATRVNPRRIPSAPVSIDNLPTVDTLERINYLPSGWQTTLPSGHTLAGIGGMESGQRRANYHPLAYIDDNAVQRLLNAPPVDLLLTHQGPAAVQGDHGSPTLDLLLERAFARFWFHGHSTPILSPTQLNKSRVVNSRAKGSMMTARE